MPDTLSRVFSSEALIKKEINSISLDYDAFLSQEYRDLVQKVETMANKSYLIVRNGKVHIKTFIQ